MPMAHGENMRNAGLATSPPRQSNSLSTMPKGNKQTEAAAKKMLATQKEAAIQHTVELYKTLAHSNPGKPVGYRTVCKMAEDELERRTGGGIQLCYGTVRARLNGTVNHPLY